jgi:hypothetical protein
MIRDPTGPEETMSIRFYLSVYPESLIASMLPPQEFGNYYAVGDRKRTRGQAIFFELDAGRLAESFDLRAARERCVPHADGSPKRSVYLAIYRVLERIPTGALGRLFLVTDDGRVLGLDAAPWTPPDQQRLHLYQELAPSTTRAVSLLDPAAFCRRITDLSQPVSVPRLAFAELTLDGLATDPVHARVDNLPYPNVEHLRDCLVGALEHPERPTKTVVRCTGGAMLYRTIEGGFFVGDPDHLVFYRFPTRDELETEHYVWWRSAMTVGFAFS